jgi:nitroimidazol reductase NimA-like FMN-containing flavoprotein (pyridoxamine 5'-phosphate oxidase superfamily)
MTIEPSSVASLCASEPPSLPNGVRTAETMTERAMVRAYQYASGVPSARTTVKRHPERGSYERHVIDAILDEALVCHVGFAIEGQPFVIPTIHARDGDVLYIHGSPGSRMLRNLRNGVDACVTVTLLDGLVLARSVYNHSMNYRSVVVIGRAQEVTDREEKLHAMHCVVEHIVPGRWEDARQPSEKEIKATTILALPLTEASAKIRTGSPVDDEDDLELPVWAGVIPLVLRTAEPLAENGVTDPPPSYVTDYELPGA